MIKYKIILTQNLMKSIFTSSSFADFKCILYAMLGKCIDLNQKKKKKKYFFVVMK